MKVILLQDVAKIGRRSEVVEVPDGYAQNKLIPKGMAQPATAANMKRIQRMQADSAASNEASASQFTAAMAVLKDTVVKVPAELNEVGHTFKAISETEIAEAVNAAGVTIESSMISIDEPIKSEGEHTVTLASGSDKSTFKIEVVKK
jgi:large subunit ribosomal protein L9